MTLAEHLIADFTAEAANTRKLLEAVPEDRLDWKPHPKSFSLGQLAGHIAETPTWVGAFVEDGMDFEQLADYQPLVVGSRAELMKAFEDAIAGFAAPLQGKDDAFMTGTWTMRKGEQVLMAGPRAKVMREIMLHHLIHHRGQLTVYLRQLDVAVPATYGGTADEPMF